MEKNEKFPSLRLLMLIAAPKLAEQAAVMFSKGALPIQYRLNALGTASSEIMDMLGLGDIDKGMLISVMPKPFANIMLGKLHSELKLDTINSGIAFTIPLTGVNSLILHMLPHVEGESAHQNERKDDITLTDMKYALITVVVNRGYSGDVMDAARAAGAGGGTVIHSRWVGNEEISSFWGLSVQEEKELVLILAHAETKVRIMREISEHCGMHSDAKGIVMSVPIDSVIGFQDNE